MLFKKQQKYKALREKHQSSLDTLFQYESQYENIFEKHYDIQKTTTNRKKKPESDKIAIKAETKIEEDIEPVHDSQQNKSKKRNEDNKELFPLKLMRPHFNIRNNTLEVKVRLKNSSGRYKISGNIWSYIEVHEKNKKRFVTYPTKSHALHKEEPLLQNFNRLSLRFSIKKFKYQSFYFSLPALKSGKIQSIGLALIDKRKKLNKQEFPKEFVAKIVEKLRNVNHNI